MSKTLLKKQIARSIREDLSRLHAGNLRNDKINDLYFKIDRIEHILALSSQVVAIECSVFQYVRGAKELITYELNRVSNTSDKDNVRTRNRGRPRRDVQ